MFARAPLYVSGTRPKTDSMDLYRTVISKGVADETLFRMERYDQTGSLEVLLARARADGE